MQVSSIFRHIHAIWVFGEVDGSPFPELCLQILWCSRSVWAQESCQCLCMLSLWAGAACSIPGKEGGWEVAGAGDEAVPGCFILLQLHSLAADFSRLLQAISIPAQQCSLVLDFPAAPAAARGILRVFSDTGGASLLPSLLWASSGTGHGECPGLGHSGTSACLSCSWFLAEKRSNC